MKVFVMGDIHGAYRALVQCLERCEFDYENDKLIQLGDITDSFPEVYECVETLLKIKNLVALKGNHDDWFIEFINTGFHPANWLHGGSATAKSYLKLSGRENLIIKTATGYKTALNNNDVPLTHRNFFNAQQLYYKDENNNCFVHAGFNRNLPFDSQSTTAFYWDRDLWRSAVNDAENFYNVNVFNEIYIGHTPTQHWFTDKPMRAQNITNLDTGAGHKGRLTIMDLHSKQYWQSDLVSELYSENARS